MGLGYVPKILVLPSCSTSGLPPQFRTNGMQPKINFLGLLWHALILILT
jgi:hypothetical protein